VWDVTAARLDDESGAARALALVIDDHTAVVQEAEHLTFLAYNDALTGLANRASFERQAQAAISRAARHGCQLAVLFIDLDRFKEVNDTLGHDAGNELLCIVGSRIKRAVRDVDVVARLSGDEFAVLLDGVKDAVEAATAAARVVAAVVKPHCIGSQEIIPAVSLGASVAAPPVAVARLMSEADAAMYYAKRRGGAQFAFFDASQHAAMARQQRLAAELYRALDRAELVLQYLPQMAVDGGQLEGFEALVRWRHPTRGLLGPDQFLPAAERSGLIAPIGDWVFEQVMTQLERWEALGIDGFRVAMNLCGPHVTHARDGFARRVLSALDAGRVGPERVEMEVTERFLDEDLLTADPMLRELQARGVRIAIDDFGTGHSSLARLESFPADVLKIDRTVIRNLSVRDGAIAKSIISLGHHLGMRVAAEGVETEEQLAALRDARCDLVAGFLFSAPLAADELPAWLDGRDASAA
jgi:diguanylate cyclase (GGDEF)-like protein